MDNNIYRNETNPIIGIPYKNINWEDIPGQPFGLASQFNLFVFGDANNIIDVEGAIAVGGSFYSTRSLSIGFEREQGQVPIESSPDLVRYLVGDIVSMRGPLVVIGHAVSGGTFRAASGSTYYIGSNDSTKQPEELTYLYQANGGSPYWGPSARGNYYIISSYDVPRIIPASRISANVSVFFQNAKNSIETFKNCIEQLNQNGTVTSNSYEWILTGNNPKQNIFTIDTRPNGLINKGIRFDIPKGSVAIVRLKTGPYAHLQYGLYGEEGLANHILYVFEDATNIHMEKSSDIWGSILAPQAMFHGHPTGGRVSGNAALNGFAVNENSGFEFHLYPFVGGIICMEDSPLQVEPEVLPTPIEAPMPEIPKQVTKPLPIIPTCPKVIPCPAAPPCPTCPEVIPCPAAPPCPTCPEVIPCPAAPPCPTCPVCPEQKPCPVCPKAAEPIICPTCPICPEQKQCPVCPTCPVCPEQKPCPVCPTCPVCPEQKPCPACPECPSQTIYIEKEMEFVTVPIPVRIEPKEQICPVCEESLITPGIIVGCISGCDCCRNHDWDIILYMMVDGKRRSIYCTTISHSGCFYFDVDYYESYILEICPTKRNCFLPTCRPKITLKNVGVANLTIE
ncbi:MAG: collagen-binding domain-containing protein [Velocimicrobium sp.]